MGKEYIKKHLEFLARIANKTVTPAAPQALLPNVNQHRDNIVSSTSEYRPNLTPSASGFSFGGPSASGQSSLTPNGGPSFGGSAASGQSGFGAGPSFGGSGSAASGQSGVGATPNPPPPTSNHGLWSISSFRELLASQENDTDAEKIDLTNEGESKIGEKRKSDQNTKEGVEKKTKPSDDLPLLGGKRLFQYVYSFLKDPTGKTGVTQTNVEANKIYDSVKARQTYFDKLATAFKEHYITNGVTKGAKFDKKREFDKKRDALAKRLSEKTGMCTEGNWKAPTESHKSLFTD
jgi:hypothetical protein